MEETKTNSQSSLDRCRLLIEEAFPSLKIEETLKYINQIKNNPRCNTCSRFYSQSSITDVKNKIKGTNIQNDQTILLRIYKNSAEKLEDSKGYCCYMINPINHVKTIIPVPDMSLCSDWTLHPNLRAFFTIIHQTINKENDKVNKELEKKRFALEQKKKAEQIIKEYHENYEEE